LFCLTNVTRQRSFGIIKRHPIQKWQLRSIAQPPPSQSVSVSLGGSCTGCQFANASSSNSAQSRPGLSTLVSRAIWRVNCNVIYRGRCALVLLPSCIASRLHAWSRMYTSINALDAVVAQLDIPQTFLRSLGSGCLEQHPYCCS